MSISISRCCRTCSSKFSLTPEQHNKYKDKGLKIPTHCPVCRKKRRQTEHTACLECGEVFELNGIEKDFYEEKGFQLPKRCLPCRRKRRETRK